MTDEVGSQLFDDASRDIIRKKLLRYMQQNAIGVPRLAEQIEIADGRGNVISIKTLQRFLEGQGKTQGDIVALCHRFTKDLT